MILERLLPSGLFVARARKKPTAVSLTFDDGPHPDFTPRILDVLRDNGAAATFFVIGKNARRHPDLVRRIVEEGHVLGCHTDSHVDLSKLGMQEALRECRVARQALEEIAGCRVRYLRPPWGRMRPTTFAVARMTRMTLALWSLDSLDHRRLGCDEILARVRPVEAGDIVLFHDDEANTVSALPRIIDYMKQRGLSSVNLERLLQLRAG